MLEAAAAAGTAKAEKRDEDYDEEDVADGDEDIELLNTTVSALS